MKRSHFLSALLFQKKKQEVDTRCPFTLKLIKPFDVGQRTPDFCRTKSISIDFTIQALVHLYASVHEPLQSITPQLLSVQYWKYALEIQCSRKLCCASQPFLTSALLFWKLSRCWMSVKNKRFFQPFLTYWSWIPQLQWLFRSL